MPCIAVETDQGRHTSLVTSLPSIICRFRGSVIMAQTNGHEARRPSAASRYPTAPSIMTMNGHFAGVGDAPTKEQYEHGIQVIDEEKEFKCVSAQNVPTNIGTICPNVLTMYQSQLEHLPSTDKNRPIWLQLPPYLSLRVAVHRQIHPPESSFWHGIWCNVRIGSPADYKRDMDVEKQARGSRRRRGAEDGR